MTWMRLHEDVVELFDEAKTLGNRSTVARERRIGLSTVDGTFRRRRLPRSTPITTPTTVVELEHDEIVLSLQRTISVSPDDKSLWLISLHRRHAVSGNYFAPLLLRYATRIGRFVENHNLNGNARSRVLPPHVLAELAAILDRVHRTLSQP
jgi:hypothetical protein